MDFDNQSMTLEEAITIIREIDPNAEETNSRRAETLILQAVHQGAEVKFPTDIMNAADVVPVVRCKDCVYYDTVGCTDGFGWCEGTMVNTGTHDNFFCAEGKKKEEA